jgi:hypothetical protein
MKKFASNLISDIKNIYLFFLINKVNKICFFNENKNTFPYLEYYLKNKKNEIIFFSLEKINYTFNKNISAIYLNFNFFIEIFFLFLKSKYVYSTSPGLNYTLFKKSIISKKSKYIYLQHSPVSLNMAYDKDAFINFDAIQVINKFQLNDVNEINKDFKKKIKPFKSKYKFLELTNNDYKNYLLVAPTWKTDFYSSGFYLELFRELKKKNINFIFRPHYMSLKKGEFDLNKLDFIKDKIDLSSKLDLTIHENLLSDWSGIYLEFIILHKKKPFLFNSKKKILNSNYLIKYNKSSIEEYARDKISFNYNFNQIDIFINDITKNISKNDKNINKFIEDNFY